MKPLRLLAALLAASALHAHAVGHLVDLTVLDRTRNVRLPVHWHEGRAYVAGQPGHEYSVTVRNRQGADVLAVVSVDGVNVVTGETAHAAQSGYVLSPHRPLDILGWRKNMAETAAFYFTALGDAYAARTGRPNDVGVIGVAVFRRKAEPPQPIALPEPRHEPRPFAPSARRDAAGPAAEDAAGAPRASGELASGAAKSQAAEAPLGTGHGRRETSHARRVAFERASAEPAETIVLHYDSRANLVARGIVREAVPVAPRQPNPFPGFVPDPAGLSALPLRPPYPG